MPEHSPLPWRISAANLIVDAAGMPIYTCTDDLEDTTIEADASLIIRAVNSHDRLIAAAKETVSYYSPDREVPLGYDQGVLEALKAAIAAAEEREI
jgi:hypothetical protein